MKIGNWATSDFDTNAVQTGSTISDIEVGFLFAWLSQDQ